MARGGPPLQRYIDREIFSVNKSRLSQALLETADSLRPYGLGRARC